ncbi:MAG: hypothetical protein Q8867_02530 [Bacteroidota bacterium]|nr:hypothetical protein [Bacteroidota bacterium]
MKRTVILLFCILFVSTASFAQGSKNETTKTNQYDVLNDFTFSYGFSSLYYLIENSNNSDHSITSPGTFILGYTRSLNKVVGVGFQMAYTPMKSTISYETKNFNYLQALARVKFQYLNKPNFAMYSGVAIGISLNYYSHTYHGVTTDQQKPVPAGQLTLVGFRVGRSPAFVGEFGIGTLSILNLGFSYKFGN